MPRRRPRLVQPHRWSLAVCHLRPPPPHPPSPDRRHRSRDRFRRGQRGHRHFGGGDTRRRQVAAASDCGIRLAFGEDHRPCLLGGAARQPPLASGGSVRRPGVARRAEPRRDAPGRRQRARSMPRTAGLHYHLSEYRRRARPASRRVPMVGRFGNAANGSRRSATRTVDRAVHRPIRHLQVILRANDRLGTGRERSHEQGYSISQPATPHSDCGTIPPGCLFRRRGKL
jgi:hypothetical protein